MDVDLRKLRYFVAVAEQLHFGRAAEQLHIAQPVLSRQIRALEAELHAQLFSRDRRRTELTRAGQQLLADAPGLLAGADALRRRVGRAARPERTFTVGFMPGLIVTSTVRSFAARHPDLSVEVLRTSWDDQIDAVHDGRVDVSYVRLPVEDAGLHLRHLFDEPRVAMLSSDHRLAGKESVEIADLAGDGLLQNPAAVPEWHDVLGAVYRPVSRTVEEKLELVAAGRGIAVLPLSAATFYSRADVVFPVISDIGPSEVCLAWDAARHDGLVEDFVAVATALSQAASASAPE
jgi:DNA-binding transcriptional LysR family regulator